MSPQPLPDVPEVPFPAYSPSSMAPPQAVTSPGSVTPGTPRTPRTPPILSGHSTPRTPRRLEQHLHQDKDSVSETTGPPKVPLESFFIEHPNGNHRAFNVPESELSDCVNMNSVRWWLMKLLQYETNGAKLKELLFYMPETVWNYVPDNKAGERVRTALWDPEFIQVLDMNQSVAAG